MFTEIFQNSWTIGIGTGLISGLFVYFVTSIIFSKRQDKERLQKIRIADNEILYAIRPLIVSELKPTLEIVEATLYATARKYELNVAELISIESIANELTKEILDNFFLTAENKLRYSELTNDLKLLTKVKVGLTEISPEKKTEKTYLDTTFLSSMFSIITALTVAITILSLKTEAIIPQDSKLENPRILALILAITSIPIAISSFYLYFKNHYKKRSVKNDNKNASESLEKK